MGPASFDASHTPAWMQAGVCDYLRQAIGEWTGQYQYTIDQVLNEMIDRCRELRLRLRRSERHSRRDLLVMLTVQTMNYLHGGNHRVAL